MVNNGMQKAHHYSPTTIKVNWTPFLTLFPLRLPANDMFFEDWSLGEFGRAVRNPSYFSTSARHAMA
jgi:hypothetical protein